MRLIRSALVLACCLPALVPAQCAASWGSGFGAPGADGRVRVLTVHDSGAGPVLYAAGDFTAIGGIGAYHIARWNGSTWSPLGLGLNQTPSSMAVLDEAAGPALYVSGNFLLAGGVISPNGIVKWNGSAWSTVPYAPSIPKALAVFDDGTGPHLYAGGNYTPSGVLKFTSGAWVPVPGYPGITSADVRALAVIDIGAGPRLYSVGQFMNTAGGSSYGFFGRWNGAAWEGAPVNGTPTKIAALHTPSGVSVYVGGQSPSQGISFVNCVIGPSTGPLPPGLSGSLLALSDFDDGTGPALYAAGSFTFGGGGVGFLSRLARWDGVSWSSIDGFNGCSASYDALAKFDFGSGPELVAGGDFRIAGGVNASNIAHWSGTSWSPMASGTTNGIGDEIFALKSAALPSGPALYAGGTFCIAPTSPGAFHANIARFDGNGWQTLGLGLTAAVQALESFDDGGGMALYAGGPSFDSGTTPLTGLGRWDGSTWSPVGGGLAGPSPSVSSLRVFDDGSGPALFVGGRFDHAGGVPVSNIASWNGTSWSALAGGLTGGPIPAATVMEVYDSGMGPALYVSGAFSIAGGPQKLASWNGIAWTVIPTSFSNPGATISSMAAFDDGSGPALWVCGTFSTIGAVAAPGFAKWNGAAWTSGVLPPGPTSLARLARLDDGSGPALYAAVVEGTGLTATRSLQRWDGSSWTQLGVPFQAAAAGNYSMNALVSHDDGSEQAIFVGGGFALAGGVPSFGLAKWVAQRPILSFTQVAGQGSGVLISDQGLLSAHEYFDIFSTAPCAGLPGTGPYIGLCAPDPAPLMMQFQMPLGSAPFHFVAPGASTGFGPFQLPSGLVIDGICFDYTSGSIGCRSRVTRFTVQ